MFKFIARWLVLGTLAILFGLAIAAAAWHQADELHKGRRSGCCCPSCPSCPSCPPSCPQR